MVGIQVFITLLAGAMVFWVGKQGADVWRDAFEVEPTRTPATTSPVGAAARGTTATPPGDPARLAPAAPAQPPGPGPAASGARTARPADSAPGAGSASEPPGTSPAATGTGDEELEANIEAAARALKHAPPSERGKRAAELVARALSRARREGERAQGHAGTPATGDDQKDDSAARKDALQEEREALRDDIEELQTDAEALVSHPPSAFGEARAERRKLERQRERLERRSAELSGRGAPPLTEAESGQLTATQAFLETARAHERGLRGRLGAILALLAAVYASLSLAQAGVLAMSRDFHDALSRELSLLVQVAPEDPPMQPRIRLDLPWVRRKTNRRVQFFLGFLPGLGVISALTWLLPMRRTVASILTALWSAYWWVVMTAGQTARAWSPPETTPQPWYLRGWTFLTSRVFLFRWSLPRAWGRIWARFSRRFYGPSERVEEQPLEFAGLALSRAVALLPILKLLVRPVFPVAAAHLLVEHASVARLAVPVTATEVADAAARAPDPEARAHSGVGA